MSVSETNRHLETLIGYRKFEVDPNNYNYTKIITLSNLNEMRN